MNRGRPQGFNIDLAGAIAASGGLPANHRLGDWPEIVRALQRGEVDAVPMLLSADRQRRFRFTAPFFYIDHTIYAPLDAQNVTSAQELANRTVAVEELSYAHRQLQAEELSVSFLLTSNTLEALQATARGEADYALLATAPADHLIQQHGLALHRIGPSLWPAGYAFAVRRDRAQLAEWLSHHLQLTIVSGRYGEIYRRWENQLAPGRNSREQVLRIVAWVVVPLAVFVALGFGWSWSLRHRVAARTHALREELRRRGRAEKEIRRLLDYDARTGLPQLHRFIGLVQDLLARAAHQGNSPKEIVAIKLTELEKVIRALGHETGNRLRIAFAERLQALDLGACGHLGRDGFMACADKGSTRHHLPAITAPLHTGDFSWSPQVLIGAALWPEHGNDAADLVRYAETALAVGIAQHRSWSLYDRDMEPDPADLQIVSDLRADGGEGLYPLFQPQLDLQSGRVCGAEALVRWQHPDLGLLSPNRLIPLLEDTGLITLVTQRMIDEAVRVGAALRRANLPCPIGVNVATRDLSSRKIVDAVASALERHRGRPGDLALELTETGVTEQITSVKQVLDELSDLGVHAAIDDFGTGYCSLEYLSAFPIRELKIDRMFVHNMQNNARHRSIVRSTISMAHELGLTSIAEGVEDDETLGMLRASGCDRAQGFAISQPLAEPALRPFLERTR